MTTTYEPSPAAKPLVMQLGKLNDEWISMQGRAKAIIARADREGRDLTPQEVADSDRLMRRFDTIEDEMSELERQIADHDEAYNGRSMGRQVPPQPIRGSGSGFSGSGTPSGGPLYTQMFGDGREQREFRNLGEFASAVAVRDPRLFQIQNASRRERRRRRGRRLLCPGRSFTPASWTRACSKRPCAPARPSSR